MYKGIFSIWLGVFLLIALIAGVITDAQAQLITSVQKTHVAELFSIGIGTKEESASVAEVDAMGKLTVAGAEGNIWGAKDGFNFVYEKLNGNGEAVVRFLGAYSTNDSSKVGLMIRESLEPNSRHVLLAVTASGLAFICREQVGAASDIVKLPSDQAPRWLKLSRVGNWFGAYLSQDGVNWTLSEWKNIKMGTDAYVGIAAGSEKGQFASQFKDLQVRATQAENLPISGTGKGLLGQYFTNMTLSGSPVLSRVDATIDYNWGFGAPLGLNKRDEFSVRWTGEIEGQFTETYTLYMESDDGARVWLDDKLVIDSWKERPLEESKCLIDLRPGQRHSIRIEFFENEEIATARLRWSSPSTPKRIIPQSQLYDAAQEPQIATTVRRNAFSELASSKTNIVVGEWQNLDIGKGASGVVVETNGVKFMRGFGNRIGGKTDVFHYFYQPMSGNGQMVLRMLNVEGAEPWAKAGLMIRESLEADSTYASLLGTVGYGLIFNYRSIAGKPTQDSTDRHYDIPYWLKISRWGNVFSGYVSTNRMDWRLVERVVIDMKQDAFVGFAICSRSDKSDCTAWFDSDEISPAEVPEKFPLTGNGDGLKVECFDNPDLVGTPGYTGIDERVDFAWYGMPPIRNRISKRFSARWTGEIQARYNEPYTLQLFSLYGARVWLNEKLIMDSKGRPQRDDLEVTINMVAGKKYLFRIECYDAAGDAQGRFKWTTPSTARRTIPQSQLYSKPTDSDGDDIPDLWEESYNLNPRDPSDASVDSDKDGLINLAEYQRFTNPRLADTDGDGLPDGWESANRLNPRSADDGRDDSDHDGLINLREYQAGTDVHEADSDHDGLDDGVEAQIGTNPLKSDIQNIKTVLEIAGANAMERLGEWKVDENTLNAVGGRGWAEYLVNIPKADCYRLEVAGLSGNSLDHDQNFELLISVDGEELGYVVLNADSTQAGVVSRLLPWLKSGEHRIRIFWDNAVWKRSFKIIAIRLQELEGEDANNNGIKDWVERQIQANCGVDGETKKGSRVSPAFIEGNGRYPSMMQFSGGVRPQIGNEGRWFANVPLSPTETTPVISSFENGGLVSTNWIEWTPTVVNLLDAQDLTIRQGDSLLLTVQAGEARKGKTEIQIDGVTDYVVIAGQPVSHRFDRPGVYTITSGTSGLLTGKVQAGKIIVRVLSTSPDTVSSAWVNKLRSWDRKNERGTVLQPDWRIALTAQTNSSSFQLGISQPADAPILTRMGDNGPVLGADRIEGFRLWSGFETGLRMLSRDQDGTELVEMGLVMSPLRKDVTVKIEVRAAGVLFDDGTTVRLLGAKDFDSLGQATVRFLRPASAKTSTCHRIKVYQGSTLLGEYP